MKVCSSSRRTGIPSEPYLSLPSLTAVLRQAGHTVIQKDINLEMYDWYFSEDFLKKVLRRVPQQLDRLRKLSKKRDLNADEMDLQLALCDLTRQRIDELIKKAEKAKAIIRGETFYDIDSWSGRFNVFREVTSVISMVYAPARICMPPMETDLSYKVFFLVRGDGCRERYAGECLSRRVRASGEAGDRARAAGRGRHLDRLAAADVLLHDLLLPSSNSTSPISMSRSAATRSRACAMCCLSRRCSNTSTVPWSMKGRRPLCSWCRRWGRSGVSLTCPTPYIRTPPAYMYRRPAFRRTWRPLPPPDFDGLPLEKYFVPTKVLPYLATRGCYWGRCEFCDHGEGYTAGYRTKKIQDILTTSGISKNKYGARHFHFTDESYPPALFRKLSRGLIDSRWASSGRRTCGLRRVCWTIKSGRMLKTRAAAISTSATSRGTSGC